MVDIAPADKLTPRQYKALSALLTEPTIRQASVTSGVPETTLYTWLRNAAFDAEYRAMRREATQQAIAVIQKFSSTAAVKLCQLAVRSRSEAIQLAASKAVLDLAIKSVELDDLIARLEALEEKYAK